MKKKTGNKGIVGPLKEDEKLLTDDKQMADQLNHFFCSVFTKEDTDQIPVAENLVGDRDTLEDILITEEKVKEKLRNLRPDSAPGPDKLWPRILQSLSSTLAQPLAMVYTKSLGEGTVPPDWKLANIAPVLKKGSKSNTGNYRPVSLTCVLCKVMESILRDEIAHVIL